ncbi:ribosome biogenesis GTP-binding protein YihA/YsxC [Pelotomaculum terephthalicicum JT]|uniref:ribosome biogenesis GTP-binding protein YihA/YsxC n=1 Tax=Pelotomaculum TaxID=191373 RepID=UPI0009CBAD9D|nr:MULTISPECIES: ribosome biogenesis GTP-binding protein YihA/YsxC [Pelotomaculum]MCG9966986.1 ribosome biogenesis GTP-binding protein YihA/YsxC [Pelotomaculum terephthalicicum JT]OPX91057.1 MAG: putative GTP-binding protein EngB [Pelotomaculum sp. PtaB.Bin117]OPY62641.1 MAG: putative GTP-binding protein EngB [Pelotomaculum sp. PtaU1.Bin065]
MKITSAEFVTSAVKAAQYPAGELMEVALAGRSNVGKSSLLNKVVNRRGLARTSNTPGRTRLINFFLINGQFHLVDLPGYGYARVAAGERENWGRMIETYLTGRKNLKGILLLIDSRHPPTDLDIQVFGWLKNCGIPVAVVTTKADKLSRSKLLRSMQTIRKELPLDGEDMLTAFSAETGQGREELLSIIEQWVNITGRIS